MSDLTAWNNTTGIKARRVAEFSDLSRDEWLEVRKKGVGGSDIAAIAGVNPFKSAIDVYLEKKGKLVVKENPKMKWGKILEDPVANEYSDSQGVKVQRVNAVLQDLEYPHFQANVDRLIVKNGHSLSDAVPLHNQLLTSGNGILEVKTTGWGAAWANEEIPDMYYLQLQWYLHITKLAWGHFAVLVSGSDFLTTNLIPYDPKVGKYLTMIADKFWHDNILGDVIPEVDQNPANYESMKLLYSDSNDKTVNIPENLNELIEKRIQIQRTISSADKSKKVIDAQILRAMENNKYGLTSKYKVTRVLKSGISLSTPKVRENYPDIFKECSSEYTTIYPLYKEIKK